LPVATPAAHNGRFTGFKGTPMLGTGRLALDRAERGYGRRVLHALDRRRIAAVALTTLLLSLGALLNPALLDFFSPAEIALAWLEHVLELSVMAAALMLAYTLLDEALPRQLPARLAVLCACLFALAAALALLLFAYYAHGFEHLPPALRLLADSLRWGLPAVFLALIADVHRRALQADSAAHGAELSRAQLGQGESEHQLALLQAQIEPHFLFNVLGNVRRLYRTEPQAGADAVASLMRYLRTALPRVRSESGCLGDELDLVRSYLELFRVRMGPRLAFSIDADPALHAAEFPPMLLVTLVENAIVHGLEPAGGGRITVQARRRRNRLEVAVLDDGRGFGAAASSGTGVGLVNVRRQLAARYRQAGRLALESLQPRGARAAISIPLRSGAPVRPPVDQACAA
jgi:signal transduction histidine kinase